MKSIMNREAPITGYTARRRNTATRETLDPLE